MNKFPEELLQLVSTMHQAGHSCYLVGGAVRDIALKKKPKDFDLTTDALPDTVCSIFKRVIPTGIQHGTVTVLIKDEAFEITTYRLDGDYSDNRRPDSIEFTTELQEDLRRRDFTINGMAMDVRTGEIIDYYDGLKDLKKKTIKAIGNPVERFTEDGLRILRAYRFSAQLGFTIDKATRKAAVQKKELLAHISQERIRDEFTKLLMSNDAGRILKELINDNILKYIIPELLDGAGMSQKGRHRLDVMEHNIQCAAIAEKLSIPLAYAALLHDVGKPACLAYDKQGEATFHKHEIEGAKIAETIMRRLRFSNDIIKTTVHLIRNHMFHYTDDWTDSAVRRFLARAGYDHIPALFALRRADSLATDGTFACMGNLKGLSERIENIIAQNNALGIKDLAVNGKDIMALPGNPKGKTVGIILNELLETVLDDPAQNTKDQLSQIAANILKKITQ